MRKQTFFGFIALALIALLLLILMGWTGRGMFRVIRPDDHVTPAHIKAKMKYHGVQVVTCDGDVCWFARDGKKIKL